LFGISVEMDSFVVNRESIVQFNEQFVDLTTKKK